jgi:hypothetical protein
MWPCDGNLAQCRMMARTARIRLKLEFSSNCIMRSLLCFLLAAATCLAQRPSAPTEESKRLFGQIDDIMGGLSEITGWKVKRKVPADYISKDQLHVFVQKRLREAVKPEELRIETITLRMFGLIPDNFDLEKATIELVTEQAAAFYDYHRKRLFITESDGTFIEKRIVLVHELAHALADQQFSLAKYIKKGNENDDEATAREAVMEGQATWLMWAYAQRLNGGDPRPSATILDTMRNSDPGSAGAQYPVFQNAPLYMRESLVFPYNQGALFQNAVIEKLGQAGFSAVFRNAPADTAQILHPAEYFEQVKPPKLNAPLPPEHKRYRTVAEGSVGEFDHSILLEQYFSHDEATRVAPHWRAGVFRLLAGKKDKQSYVLTYESEWDSADSAREWYGFYKRILEQRNAPASFDVRLDGNRVTSRISRTIN